MTNFNFGVNYNYLFNTAVSHLFQIPDGVIWGQ